jgi:mRNA-degrading endonuclease RelE of RelBE toxin-antitoxin system
MSTVYRLHYAQACRGQIAALHPDLRRIVRSRLDALRTTPFAGKRLERELAGYRSLRARHFRIIYRVDEANGILEIHYIGHRRDIYETLAARER